MRVRVHFLPGLHRLANRPRDTLCLGRLIERRRVRMSWTFGFMSVKQL